MEITAKDMAKLSKARAKRERKRHRGGAADSIQAHCAEWLEDAGLA